jgi:succinate dehydrogenase/fumarate reductase flavoprotein subunit
VSKQTPDFDLIVLGSGAGGMTAALTASVLGLNVLLVEKTAAIGGTTSRSAGAVWIPNSRHSTKGDTPEQALAYLRGSLGNRMRESMVAAFLRAGPQMIDFLEDNTSVTFRAFAHRGLSGDARRRDAEQPRSRAGAFQWRGAREAFGSPAHAVAGIHAAGRHDGRPHRHRPFLNATKSLASLQHVAALVGRYGADRLRFGRGARLVMGNALAGRLYYSLLQRHVPILMSAEASSLIEQEGRVAGVELQTCDGVRDVGSRCGVVLATGGISRHTRLRQQLMPAALSADTPVVESATGDGAMLAQTAGAYLGDNHASNAFWAPISTRVRRDGSTAVFPHLVLDRGKPGLIAVNPDGKRFVSEATNYHLFVEAMLAELARRPAQPCFLICDDDFIAKYGLGMVRPRRINLRRALAEDYVVRVGTLDGLAAELGVTAAAVSATVERHNWFARTGVDEDFGKGSDAYQRNLGDAAHVPNPCIGPLGKPPFYAVKIYPGDIGASCGLVTNERAQVLRKDGSTVEGLYACGNDMDSIMAGIYPGPGITLGPAMTFGYLAARHAAEQ